MKKSFYVLIKIDDEYGYEVFKGIAFTLASAYSMVKERLMTNTLNSYMGVEFHDWQLVETDSLDEFYETIPDHLWDTEYRIFVFDEHGTNTENLAVFSARTRKGETK